MALASGFINLTKLIQNFVTSGTKVSKVQNYLNPAKLDGIEELGKKGYDELQDIVQNKLIQITPENRSQLFNISGKGGAHSGFVVSEKEAPEIGKAIQKILKENLTDSSTVLTDKMGVGVATTRINKEKSLGIINRGDGEELFISKELSNKKIDGLDPESFLIKQLQLRRPGDRKFKKHLNVDPSTGINSKIYTTDETAKLLNTSRSTIKRLNNFLAPKAGVKSFDELPIKDKSLFQRNKRAVLKEQSDSIFEEKVRVAKKGTEVKLAHLLAKEFPTEYMPEQSLATLGFMDEFTNSVLMAPFDAYAARLTAQANNLIKSVVVKDMSRLKTNVNPNKITEVKSKLTALNQQLKLIADDTAGGVVVPQWNVNALGIPGVKKVSLYGTKNNSFSFAEQIDSIKKVLPSISKTSESRKQLVLDTIPDLALQMKNTATGAIKRMAPVLKNKKQYNVIKNKAVEFGIEMPDEFIQLEKLLNDVDQLPSYANFVAKDGGRVGFEIGGIVGGKEKFGGISGSNFKGIGQTNKVGTIESMLAGIGAGIIDIPKGAFSLGAALVDLGLGTNHAAKIENFFDDLTGLDEKAEASFAGEMTRIITNLGIPGTQAFKLGSRLTKQALVAKQKKNYFNLTDKKMEAKMQDALNANGRLLTTVGGAAGIGVSDAIFVGDPEQVGTLGDMFGGGPTALTPNDDDNAAREVMNRMKFGLESSLLAGIIGGTGSAIKTAVKRNGDLKDNNKAIEFILSKFRPRGSKPQEFFDLERAQLGIRSADVNRAQEIQRGVDKHIDALFPQLKNTFNKTTQKTRANLLKDLNETLLSGEVDIDTVTGAFKFGAMDPTLVARDTARLRKLGAKNPKAIFDSFYDMRVEWDQMFTSLGGRMDKKTLAEFGSSFGKKVADYLGSTYQIFQNKGLIPISNFKPGQEAIDKAVALFKDAAKKAGKNLTDEEAKHYVDNVVETASQPRGLSTSAEKTAGVMFNAPDFFLKRTVMDDLEFKGIIKLSDVDDEAKKVIENLLGKVEDPTQTILGGTARLSMITRRNEFFDDLLKSSTESQKAGKKGFFYDDELEAIAAFGRENVKKVEMDPNKALEAGVTNPLNGKFAHKGVADALEETSQSVLGDGALNNIYSSFILYPKAASQLAKTVLSPVTHFRNFISAGAFAAGNGIIPNAEAFQTAFKSLQTNLKGTRQQNDFYRKLLRLGVVNSNVRLGDLQKLLGDVKFGASSATIPALRQLAKQGSRLKKGAEEFYTAEDDFWKITSFAMERQRYEQAYKKAGILKSADELDEIAADIVRNNIPNYDYVNDFVKGLRKFPIGNFVSFPAEIMRTSGNILNRAFKEINFKHTLADGRVIKPLSGIGYKRLFGFGATAVAIPYGTVEAAKAIYNVSGAEMNALRRFVPDWSKNSTLIPIKDEDGNLKYIDFSHANAYDTMIRPFTAMFNAVRDGSEDEAPVMKSVFKGLYEGIGETISPFVSEAIWTQAATDIFLRGGRTKTGQRLYTEQTPFGEKASIIASHLVETQLPGSIGTFKRLGLAATSKPDEYGREYELTDEALGFMGMRAVKVDPINAMKFKIADFTRGINNSRREFTTPLLRGGPVTAEQIVDRYMVANEQLYKVQQEMNKDYYGARLLGSSQGALDLEFKDRVSNVALRAIKNGQFKPFIPSENIIKSFAENARNLGVSNPYNEAKATIDRLARQYSKSNIIFDAFPFNNNPFTRVEETTLPTAGLGQTGVSLPNLGTNLLGPTMPGGVNSIGNTLAKLEQVDKVFDI